MANSSSQEPLAAKQPSQPPWAEQTVKSGDNLSLIFKRAGYNDGDLHKVISQASDGKSLGRIFPGQTIAFQADESGNLAAVRHVKSALETVTYRRGISGFDSQVEIRSPEPRETWAAGEIISSLFLAGQEAGLSQNMIMELANIFGGVIDFVQDPRKGDTIHLVYEDLYLDGEKYKDGDIIAASFTNQGKTFNAFRYTEANGDVNYYNEEGVSMRKAFLLAPVDFTRISSNFNPRRLHPIYKTSRPHRGTDYAASRGTPVYAAGDGRVYKTGYSKANGNYVFIQHGEQYVTKYLHLHKRKVKKGQRVSQSQIIGTVGSTGAATGPHLHYEFLMNGVHRNPRTIHKKLPKAKSLAAAEMPRFQQAINRASGQLAALRSDNRLAMSDSATPATAAH
jgi:murein DD-endopeptidase MepM/ murein hydrolase activator NlpD